MKNRKLLDRITSKILNKMNPNHAADDRRFTKAAHHCGMSRNKLKRIYYEYWGGMGGYRKFADMILKGKLVYCKDAWGDFYAPRDKNYYIRKDGTGYYFRGENKGKVIH